MRKSKKGSLLADLWELIRKKKSFVYGDLTAKKEGHDMAFHAWFAALGRAGYIKQVSSSIYIRERTYVLVNDTGKLHPIFRQNKGKDIGASVYDQNTYDEVFIKGARVRQENRYKSAIDAFLSEHREFDYERFKHTLFANPKHPKGFDYALMHYYLDALVVRGKIEEFEKHRYRSI